jgi:hypothetical protein
MQAFEQDPSLDIVFGYAQQVRQLPGGEPIELGKFIARLPGAMLIRRASFDRLMGFDARVRIGEGLDFVSRAKDAGLRYEVLEEIVLERRIHGSNMGIRERHRRDDYVRLVAEILARRREMAPDARCTK